MRNKYFESVLPKKCLDKKTHFLTFLDKMQFSAILCFRLMTDFVQVGHTCEK